jgi:hypothetical protein
MEGQRSAGPVESIVEYSYDGKTYFVVSTRTTIGSYMTIYDPSLRQLHTEWGGAWDPHNSTVAGVSGTGKPEIVMLTKGSKEGNNGFQQSIEVKRFDPTTFQPIGTPQTVQGAPIHMRVLDDGKVQLFMAEEPKEKTAAGTGVETITLPKPPEDTKVNDFDRVTYRLGEVRTTDTPGADYLVYVIRGDHSIDQGAMMSALPARDARIAYLEKNTIGTSTVIVSDPSTPAKPLARLEIDFEVRRMRIEVKDKHHLAVHLVGERGGRFLTAQPAEKTVEIRL